MGPAEIGWRVEQIVRGRLERIGMGQARQVPAPTSEFAFGKAFVKPPNEGIDTDALRRAADALLAGRWSVFALRDVQLGFPPEWNRDPRTGTLAPLDFGKTIDYRDEKIVGDIKYLWEPSRHLQLVTLAQAWAATRETRYLAGVGSLIRSWLAQCPYPNGVHWTSSLELSVRLLNWSVTWQLIGGPASPLFEGRDGAVLRNDWLQAIYRHTHFVAGHLSAHSSANNHLFGEYMGLYIAGTSWPCWPQMVRWHQIGKAGLEAEALRQNTPDGVNREQAIYYQHEVMDMMLITLLAARAQGDDFSQPYLARLEALAAFVHALMDVGGNVPMQGDADDALMIKLAHREDFSPYASLLATCALLFSREDLRAKAGTLDDKSRWLMGPNADQRWSKLAATPAAPKLAFPDGGHYLLGHNWDQPDEIRIAIDCAPLGYLSIAAHGHADALAFTLSASGLEFLIDPGTYAYHTQREWRDYFRGTLAHNTVRIDKADQSEIGGNFMWLAKANARALHHSPHSQPQGFVGEHDGYRRLTAPAVHRREIRFDSEQTTITVIDDISGAGVHHIELPWHWHEHADVVADVSNRSVRVCRENVTVLMECDHPALHLTQHRGSELPILGWVSRRFDEKQPSTCTIFAGAIDGPARVVTTLRISSVNVADAEVLESH